ncbi:MAG: Crp/Fnr family transcriptional regulator [Candidatus Marinimicrobia bacterium]|nr:Crp/Fnr family transcriptional regulator [Candidatus Neomarinimicrobiota bacterium]
MYRDLEEIPLFDGIKSSDLEKIAQYFIYKIYKRNQLIIIEGDIGKHFFIIKKGKVKISRSNNDGQEIILALLHEGDFFGELSILDEDTCSASVCSQQSCEILCIQHENFKKLLTSIPDLSYCLLCHMAQRIRTSNQCIENLNNHNSTKRIGGVLVHLAEHSGYRYKQSVIIKKLPFQHDIAALAGTSRETVSRTFSYMENHQYIKKSGRHLVISDYPRFYEEFSS